MLTFSFILLVISVELTVTEAAEIREKRSYMKECKEEVISRDPCHLKTCPEGEQSNPEYVYYPCSMPEVCPQKEIDQTAKCCEEKCVCGDGENRYKIGEEFEFHDGDQEYECRCEVDDHGDEIPACYEIFPATEEGEESGIPDILPF